MLVAGNLSYAKYNAAYYYYNVMAVQCCRFCIHVFDVLLLLLLLLSRGVGVAIQNIFARLPLSPPPCLRQFTAYRF